MTRRLIKLWLRNLAVAFGIVIGLFLLGFIILFLNAYMGTPVFTIVFVSVSMVVWLVLMCYKLAVEQLESENHRKQHIMDILKKD